MRLEEMKFLATPTKDLSEDDMLTYLHHEGFFVEEESCGSCEEKGGNVARDEIVDEECCYEKSYNVNDELSENKGRYWDVWSGRWTNDKAIYDCEGWFIGWREDYSTDDVKGVFVEKECSSREEKVGNVTGDERECCYEKSCNVNGELSGNKGRYWDIWSGRWTNDKAIYDCEGWFIGWRE
uniref:Uncharacterized protein n=1 Tax=Tanacetum cinerariifolium TaxID=118510 RepID=A0A699KZI7_TANCI|nr:hypothetical protein [Tanacetum cinerariifolium]